jgi:hypothetical protein
MDADELSYWQIAHVGGHIERVDKATGDQIVAGLVSAAREKQPFSELLFECTMLTGTKGYLLGAHIVGIGWCTPESRAHDDEITNALEKEQEAHEPPDWQP